MHPILNIAVRAARTAGDLIAGYYETPNKIKNNQEDDSYIINLDKIIEKAIITIVHKSYPQHIFVTHKNSKHKNSDQTIQWIINPLDGTMNFMRRLPHFAVSIAVRIKGRTEIAVIYDPMRNELFTATRGYGTQLNGYRLRSSNIRDLNRAILAADFSFKKKENYIICMNILNKLSILCADFRSIGSTALDLAYVAAGRVDGYFKIGVKLWNFAAGELIAREAGVIICDFSGGCNYLLTGNVIASNIHILKSIFMNLRNELNKIV